MFKKIFTIIITETISIIMIKKIKEIKKKIKLAKIGAIIFSIIFLALITNSIYLTIKVHNLEKNIIEQKK